MWKWAAVFEISPFLTAGSSFVAAYMMTLLFPWSLIQSSPFFAFSFFLSFSYWFSSETEALYEVCPHAEMLIVAWWIMPYRECGADSYVSTSNKCSHVPHIWPAGTGQCVNDVNGYIPGMATSTRFQMTIEFHFILMYPITHSVDYK